MNCSIWKVKLIYQEQNNIPFTNICKILDILVKETGPGVVLTNVQICAKFGCPTYCARCFCVDTQLGTAAFFCESDVDLAG